jgi:hypothetical protein
MKQQINLIVFDGNLCYVTLVGGFETTKVRDCNIVTTKPNIMSALIELTIDEFFSVLLSENMIEEVWRKNERLD